MVIAIFIISIIISYFGQGTLRLEALENSSLLGVYGTLLGALIGGTFKLVGSVWVNKRHIKVQTNIKRKKLIYRPLYDEIVVIHNCILEENPFPNYIVFEKRQQTMIRYPHYTANKNLFKDRSLFIDDEDIHEFLNALELHSSGEEVKIIFEGASVKLVAKFEAENNPLYNRAKEAGIIAGGIA
jgi:hypothetical protein